MGELWSGVTIYMPTKQDYACVAGLIKELFDYECHWPVEEYDEKYNCIRIRELHVDEDDVRGFAKVLDEQIMKVADGSEYKEIWENVSFTIDGYTSYGSEGSETWYEIERKNKTLFIKETENFICCQSRSEPMDEEFADAYEEFCFENKYMCSDIKKVFPKEKYEPNVEYYITYSNVYKEVPWCEQRPLRNVDDEIKDVLNVILNKKDNETKK